MSEDRRISPDLAAAASTRNRNEPKDPDARRSGLDHLFRVSLSEIRLGQEHRCQRFVVIMIVAGERIEQLVDRLVETFELAFRKIDLIAAASRAVCDPKFITLLFTCRDQSFSSNARAFASIATQAEESRAFFVQFLRRDIDLRLVIGIEARS